MRYNMWVMLYVKNFLASMLAGNVINRKKNINKFGIMRYIYMAKISYIYFVPNLQMCLIYR